MTMRALIALPALAMLLLAAGCQKVPVVERPPVESVQHGFRGTGMVQVYNPRTLARQAQDHAVPEALPQVPGDGPKAGEVYQNVQVLKDLGVGQFTRLMVAMTSWVAPNEGCGYCHNLQNLADDSVYTKQVARKMLQMTQHVNTQWKSHVGDTGVTCWTCHRGKAVPQYTWFTVPPQNLKSNFIGDKAAQNTPAESVGLSSLPYDPFQPYLRDALPIRVIGKDVLPGVEGANNRSSIKQAEFTYGLMMHMSEGLGVNCTYCHNSRSFASWEGPTQRVTAYHGIRMARDINLAYLEPITGVFPKHRLGALGDVAKTNCATCHQGAYKPLYGASMLKDYPELAAAPAAAATAPAAAALQGTLARVLFAVGRAEIAPQFRAQIATVAGTLAKTGTRIDISGFADQTGNRDSNFELAKQRAIAVRDALKAAGVPDDRINLLKPEFVIGGTSEDARRVEINVAK